MSQRDLSVFLNPSFAYTLGSNVALHGGGFDDEIVAAVKEAFPEEFAAGEKAGSLATEPAAESPTYDFD